MKNYNKAVPVIKDLDGKALKNGTDFIVTSREKTDENGTSLEGELSVGDKVRITVEGKENGAYKGKAFVDFRIIDNDKDISKAKVAVAPQSYTGNEIQLSGTQIKVTMTGAENPLKEAEDYKIVDYSYSNNINKGTGKVTIQGINSYGGTKTVTFKINAHDFDRDMSWYNNYYSRIMLWFNEAFSQ